MRLDATAQLVYEEKGKEAYTDVDVWDCWENSEEYQLKFGDE